MVGFSDVRASAHNELPASVEILGVKVEKEKYYRYTPKQKDENKKYPELCWVLGLAYNDKREVVVRLSTLDKKELSLIGSDFEFIENALPDDDEKFDWLELIGESLGA